MSRVATARATPAITQPLETYAYNALRDMIIRGELPPGAQLVQEELAAQLGISRTPLRRALTMLAAQRFIELSPRQNAFVRTFTPSELASIFEIRAVLEGLACRFVAGRAEPKHLAFLRALIVEAAGQATPDDWSRYRAADIEFHTYLVEVAGDDHLGSVLESVQVVSLSLAQGLLRPPSETLLEHLAILDALAAGQADEAERAMITHIRRTVANIHARGPLQRAAQPVLNDLAALLDRRVALAVRYAEHVIIIAQDHHKTQLEPASLHASAARDLFEEASASPSAFWQRANTLAVPVLAPHGLTAALTLVGREDEQDALPKLADALRHHADLITQCLGGTP